MKKHFHIIFKGKSTKYINKKKERNIFTKHNIKKKRSTIRKEKRDTKRNVRRVKASY